MQTETTSNETSLRPGMTIRDEFGAWTLERDEDGWFARQRSIEVMLLDAASFRRFGLDAPRGF